ncbi:MAG: DUF1800 domain-containing protein [Bacteroidia bacterium]|nr:DUF1800 domain-containing protein [Bacteroidia bacterium]
MNKKGSSLGKLLHLMNRAGFGVTVPFCKKYGDGLNMDGLVNDLFTLHANYEPLVLSSPDPTLSELKKMSKSVRKQYRETSRDKISKLNISWIRRMEKDEAMFREKVALFWHGHFACRHNHPAFVLSYINTLRKHALGSFREMVIALSREPAMLDFLNNRQNRKDHPNENFARELMELFTIGRGNYSEKDVREAARAFTGHTLSGEGTFTVSQEWHDEGEKEFMEKKGNWSGDDIINILLSRKETAQFICGKIYRHFVNETPDNSRISEMAEVFFNSDYNIDTLFRFLFRAEWFFNSVHYCALIRSPVEILVNLHRKFKITYEDDKTMLLIQHMLGQVLFYPPNVAGWPGGKHWIDSSRLMTRMRLASLLLNSGEIEWNDEKDDAENTLPEKVKARIRRKFGAKANWEAFQLDFPGTNLIAHADHIIGEIQSTTAKEIMYSIRERDYKGQAIVLLSFPEFQLG